MIKQLLPFITAIFAVGCATESPPVQITTDHPAHPHAAAAAPAVMSNTLAIEASPTTAPASAPTMPEEGAHEHHH